MREDIIQFFTDQEEEFIHALVKIGQTRTVASVLVFLSKTPEATSRDIERGTDLRQSEVSMAMKYLLERTWVTRRDDPTLRKGQPIKIYTLVVPMTKIFRILERDIKEEAQENLAAIKRMREIC